MPFRLKSGDWFSLPKDGSPMDLDQRLRRSLRIQRLVPAVASLVIGIAAVVWQAARAMDNMVLFVGCLFIMTGVTGIYFVLRGE